MISASTRLIQISRRPHLAFLIVTIFNYVFLPSLNEDIHTGPKSRYTLNDVEYKFWVILFILDNFKRSFI